MIVGTFNGLSDTDGPSFRRIVEILDTLVKYRSCVVMLDLECDDLVNEMFSTFFSVVRYVLFHYLFNVKNRLLIGSAYQKVCVACNMSAFVFVEYRTLKWLYGTI